MVMLRSYLIVLYLTSCALVVAQNSKPEFTENYNRYHSLLPRTRVYLSTSQEKYFPGDTIFFRCYYLTDSQTLVSGKHLITVALSDYRGFGIKYSTLVAQQGSGNSQLILPDTLKAGFYRLTAYSSWMRNFPANSWGEKEVTIVQKNQLEKRSEICVKVDGGRIVKDLTNRIIVKTPRPNQTIRLVDEAQQEVTRGNSNDHGVIDLYFTPTEKLQYFIKSIGYPDFKLGQASDGAVISIENPPSLISIKIEILLPILSKHEKKQLTLLTTSHGKVFYETTFIGAEKNIIEIKPLDQHLPFGVNTIHLLDSEGHLISSKDFFIENKSKAVATLHLIKDNFRTRDNVKIEIAVTDEAGLPVEGQFSISVSNSGVFGKRSKKVFAAGSLPPYFISDLSGSLDQQLIWSHQPEDWSKILVEKIERPLYNFNSTMQKKGIALKSDSITPLPESTTILFYFQKSGLRYQTSVAKNGEFSLNLLDFYGEDELIYLAQYQEEPIKNVYIRWIEEYFPFTPTSAGIELDKPDAYAAFTKNRGTIEKAFNAYENTQLNSPFLQIQKVKDIAEADVEVDVTRYVSFSTVAELINEIIPSMSCQQRNKKIKVRVGLPFPMKEKDDPLFFIDGIATRNTELFLALKPQEIQTIKVIYQPRKLLPLGLLGKNGIVIVRTKKGNGISTNKENGLKISGLTMPIELGNQDLTTKSIQKPIFKSTLLWMPVVRFEKETKKSIEFWLTDDVGEMEILIEGITKDGVLFSTSTSINVTQAKNE